MPRWKRFGPLTVVVTVALFLSACASDAPQDTLEPKGPIARDIDNLVNPVFIVAAIVFVLVEVGVLFLVFRFRRRHDDDDLPAQTHGNIPLEIGGPIIRNKLFAFSNYDQQNRNEPVIVTPGTILDGFDTTLASITNQAERERFVAAGSFVRLVGQVLRGRAHRDFVALLLRHRRIVNSRAPWPTASRRASCPRTSRGWARRCARWPRPARTSFTST